MTVWPDRRFDHPMVFALDHPAAPKPQEIDVNRLLFGPVSIEWDRWVGVWDPPANGNGAVAAMLPIRYVLPREVAQGAGASSGKEEHDS
jgi:hypothetical protein